MSCVNTFAYDLFLFSRHPLTGNPDYTVKNSAYFVSIINEERVDENEIMVSLTFDVES